MTADVSSPEQGDASLLLLLNPTLNLRRLRSPRTPRFFLFFERGIVTLPCFKLSRPKVRLHEHCLAHTQFFHDKQSD